jgi:hypothetical protein
MENAVLLTAKTAAVLEVLKETGAKMFAQDIADAKPGMFDKGARSVSPILTNLHRKGLIDKEKATVSAPNAEGNVVSKELTRYWVVEAGAELEYSIKAE